MNHLGERADARANRSRVVEAAREVFAERGLGAEIREIAERAGVGMGTVYRNFANRDELVVAIVNDLVGDVERVLDRAEAAPNPHEGLLLLLNGGWEIADRHGDLMHALREHELGPSIAKDRMNHRLSALLEGCAARGVTRADIPVPFLAELLIALFTVYRETRPELGAESARRCCSEAFLRVALASADC